MTGSFVYSTVYIVLLELEPGSCTEVGRYSTNDLYPQLFRLFKKVSYQNYPLENQGLKWDKKARQW